MSVDASRRALRVEQGRQPIGADVDGVDDGALVEQAVGDRPADARRGPGDEVVALRVPAAHRGHRAGPVGWRSITPGRASTTRSRCSPLTIWSMRACAAMRPISNSGVWIVVRGGEV